MSTKPRRLRRLAVLVLELVIAVMVVVAYIAILPRGFEVF